MVAPDALDEEIQRFTDIIQARSPAAIRIGKQTFYKQIDAPIGSAYDTASGAMAGNLLLEDAAEGMDAFLGKRPAVWRGR